MDPGALVRSPGNGTDQRDTLENKALAALFFFAHFLS